MRPIAPTTPPTTGTAVSLGLDDIPELACACAWPEVEAGEEFSNVADGAWNPLPLLFPDTILGEACVSLCATTMAVVEEVVGVVPFDAGKAVALVTSACVIDVDDVLTTAADVVVAPIEVVLATDDPAAALNKEDAPPATFG